MQSYIIGPAYKNNQLSVQQLPHFFSTVKEEHTRLDNTIKQTILMYQQLALSVEEDQKQFHDTISFYLAVLGDQEMITLIKKRIERKNETAEQAIQSYFEDYRKRLDSQDSYMKERFFDLNDIKSHLLKQLENSQTEIVKQMNHSKKPYIYVLDNLSISAFYMIDFQDVLAVVAQQGGYNSHAAIILNANQIPLFIISDVLRHFENGDELLIDARTQTITFKPSIRIIQKVKTLQKGETHKKAAKFTSPIRIGENKEIHLYPAVNQIKEVNEPFIGHSEGIGLYRTEFLAFERGSFLSEVEQYQFYFELSKSIPTKRVYFRLYDIEPDKTLSSIEPNGYGIHFLTQNPQVTKTQLRALLRVSTKCPIGITIPMIESPKDIDKIKNQILEVESELLAENPEFEFQYFLGAMIETIPITHAVSKISGLDYLQIGSNDLLSRLLEVKRDSLDFSSDLFYNPLFLRMLKRITDDATQKKIPLFLCGEAANHLSIVLLLAAIGITRFVPSPTKIQEVYMSIDGKKVELLESILPSILSLENGQQVQKKLRFI